MAKKKQSTALPPDSQRLPQNIICIGEQVPEDKHIYISQSAYKEIHAFTKNKTTNESGGMLIGRVIEAFNKVNIIVNGFIEAKYTQSTPTTLTFTHETWTACHKTLDKTFPGQKIVGWIHTHPNFGIFLSNHDKFIQESTFNDENQIALVVDPIRNEEGFFYWKNGNIEQCSGFYIFEKNGKPIKVNAKSKETASDGAVEKAGIGWKVLTAILTIAVLIQLFSVFSMRKKIKAMEKQLDSYSVVYEVLAPIFEQGGIENEPAGNQAPQSVPPMSPDLPQNGAYTEPGTATETQAVPMETALPTESEGAS